MRACSKCCVLGMFTCVHVPALWFQYGECCGYYSCPSLPVWDCVWCVYSCAHGVVLMWLSRCCFHWPAINMHFTTSVWSCLGCACLAQQGKQSGHPDRFQFGKASPLLQERWGVLSTEALCVPFSPQPFHTKESLQNWGDDICFLKEHTGFSRGGFYPHLYPRTCAIQVEHWCIAVVGFCGKVW